MTLPLAILAGGRATRLGALASDRPKSLVEVAGRPFIAHQLDLLARKGVQTVVVCLGHMGDRIRAAIGDGSAFGVRIRYSVDGDRPLGTGGAIRHALPLLGPAFFVLYGDSYLDCDYRDVARAFAASGYDGLMTVLRNEDQWDRSNVLFENDRVVRYDKINPSPAMRHIDYGLGAFKAQVFERHPDGSTFDLADVYRGLVARGALAAHEVSHRFYEIGTPEGLAETESHLGDARV